METWFRAIAVSSPDAQGRISVRVPALGGDNTITSLPFDTRDTVNEGEGVWVFFEQGDLSRPIWAGRWISHE